MKPTLPIRHAKSDDGSAVMQLKSVRDYFSWFPALRKHLLARALSRAREENVIGESWQLLSTDRNVLFNEMEYHLPVNEGLEALEEVRRFIEKKRPDIFFPFEARRTSGDTAWLSPFQGEERISVAVHCYAEDAFEFLFTDIEPIFLRRGGRPHWGKLNRLDFATAQSLYPDFDRFRDLRHHLDPNGVMLNPIWPICSGCHNDPGGRIKGRRPVIGKAALMPAYFAGLQSALAKKHLAEPVLVLDKQRLDRNITRLRDRLPRDMAYRIVAKSLPCVPLLQHIAKRPD